MRVTLVLDLSINRVINLWKLRKIKSRKDFHKVERRARYLWLDTGLKLKLTKRKISIPPWDLIILQLPSLRKKHQWCYHLVPDMELQISTKTLWVVVDPHTLTNLLVTLTTIQINHKRFQIVNKGQDLTLRIEMIKINCSLCKMSRMPSNNNFSITIRINLRTLG